jgi:hypothetical protein
VLPFQKDSGPVSKKQTLVNISLVKGRTVAPTFFLNDLWKELHVAAVILRPPADLEHNLYTLNGSYCRSCNHPSNASGQEVLGEITRFFTHFQRGT